MGPLRIPRRSGPFACPSPVAADAVAVEVTAGVGGGLRGNRLPYLNLHGRRRLGFHGRRGCHGRGDGGRRLGSGHGQQNIEGTRAKLKRLAKLGFLTKVDTGSFARKQ
ncbi:hypothetical protein ACIF80_16965 [Streptomyces sp. NPDC085927]|uniref:hypothetical protein n=1 Tax=Streptomyces sp. NPDC085927 TaxID=3365738 RepID=UPI0037D84D17